MAESWYITLDESASGAGDGTTFGNLDANDLSPDWTIGKWNPLNDPVGTNRGQSYQWDFTAYFNYNTIGDVVDRWDTLRQSLIGTHDFRIYDENDVLRFSFLQTDFVNGPQVTSVVPTTAAGRWNQWLAAKITITANKGNEAIATHRGALFVRSSESVTGDDFTETTTFTIVAEGEYSDCLALVQERLNVLPDSFETEIIKEREQGRVTGRAVQKEPSGGSGSGGGKSWTTRLSIIHSDNRAPKIPIELTGGLLPVIRDGMRPPYLTTITHERESKTGEFVSVDFGVPGDSSYTQSINKDGDTWKETVTMSFMNNTDRDIVALANRILNA